MINQPPKPVRGINWTRVLADAGIPEPPWGNSEKPDSPTPEIQAPEPEDRENWMHV
jgi:hypothetical protein